MLNKCLGVIGGAAVLASLGAAFSSPSQAQSSTRFYCDTTGAYPRTMVNSSGTPRVLINWATNTFAGSGYDNYTRCQMVSGKFQTLRNTTGLGYITAGIVNGQSVICATVPNGSCNGANQLFTVRPGVDTARTLQELFNVRDGLSTTGLVESEGRVYVDLEAVVNSLESGAGSSQPAANPGGSVAPAPNSSPSGGAGSVF